MLLCGLFLIFLITDSSIAQPMTITDTGNAFATDVGMPVPPFAPGTLSGWDIHRVYLNYDVLNDRMGVEFDMYNPTGIFGDADGDDDPGNTSAPLASVGGSDNADLAGTESGVFLVDTNNDGQPEVAVGIHNAPVFFNHSTVPTGVLNWHPTKGQTTIRLRATGI